MPKTTWHSLAVESTLKILNTHLLGLSWQEAATRLEKQGPNTLPPEKTRHLFRRLFDQLNNVLIYILFAAALITASLAHWIDMTVILAVICLNAILGLIQEGKAEKALNALRQMLPVYANVIRSGKRGRILVEELVPGDIVLLRSGDKVPADLRLVKVANLQIQEALLTGESVPDEKQVDPVPDNTPLADRSSMAYSGTFVTYGTGMGVIVATGRDSEVGNISSLLSRLSPLSTPLLRQMAIFARWLAITILFFSGFIFLFGIFYRGYPFEAMFLAAVAIAVSAIPEGLPTVMTIMLAIGVTRMARYKVIVRRLPAVETLSSMTVICTDKTGTLTANELTVQRILKPGKEFTVSGSGYNDSGYIIHQNNVVNVDAELNLLLLIRAGVLCNDAELHQENDAWHLFGNPIDGALLALGLKAGMTHKRIMDENPREDTIPFDSMHKFMASLHQDHQGHATVYVKGAPEKIIAMSSFQLMNNTQEIINKTFWLAQANRLAESGMRLLALAYRDLDQKSNLSFKNVEKN